MRIYFDNGEPVPAVYVDDLTPMSTAPAPTAPERRQRRTLTPWQGFVVCYATMMAGIALLLRELVLRTGGNQAGGAVIVALVALVALLAALLAALGVRAFDHRAGRL